MGDTTIGGRLTVGGVAQLNDVVINNGRFEGEIFSGPLELSNDSADGKSFYFPAGEILNKSNRRYEEFVVDPGENGDEGIRYANLNVKGQYGNLEFWGIVINFTYTGFSKWHLGYINFFDKAANMIFSTDNSGQALSGWQVKNYELQFDLTWTENGDTKTMRLKDLPTSCPLESSVVWNDNGTLKIS